MKGRLHILLMPDWYPSPENPVAGPFMRDLAHAISTLHDVTVLARPSALAPREEVEDGVRVIRTPATRLPGRAATVARLLALNRTVAQLRREGRPPDLIHAHVFPSGALAALVGRHRGLPVVITENLSDVVRGSVSRRDARVARFAYRRAACVCPVSPLMEQCLRQLEPRGRYEVVPDIVDVEAFSNSPRPPRAAPGENVVAVSNLIPRKGLVYLIEATRMFVAEGRGVTVSVIGEGPERSALEAQSVGLPVTFLGARSREEVVEIVRAADVFAMPTLADPFGISAVEALAAGVPVVVTSASGTADLIGAHGGRVVPPGDSRALHEALLELLDAPNSVPPNAAAELRAYCGSEAVAQRLDSIYRSLPGISSRRSVPRPGEEGHS